MQRETLASRHYGDGTHKRLATGGTSTCLFSGHVICAIHFPRSGEGSCVCAFEQDLTFPVDLISDFSTSNIDLYIQ